MKQPRTGSLCAGPTQPGKRPGSGAGDGRSFRQVGGAPPNPFRFERAFDHLLPLFQKTLPNLFQPSLDGLLQGELSFCGSSQDLVPTLRGGVTVAAAFSGAGKMPALPSDGHRMTQCSAG
jgi:hypothetical protein